MINAYLGILWAYSGITQRSLRIPFKDHSEIKLSLTKWQKIVTLGLSNAEAHQNIFPAYGEFVTSAHWGGQQQNLACRNIS